MSKRKKDSLDAEDYHANKKCKKILKTEEMPITSENIELPCSHADDRTEAEPSKVYKFPLDKLKNIEQYKSKSIEPFVALTPLVLLACGSFNPITFLHLRLFGMEKTSNHISIIIY